MDRGKINHMNNGHLHEPLASCFIDMTGNMTIV